MFASILIVSTISCGSSGGSESEVVDDTVVATEATSTDGTSDAGSDPGVDTFCEDYVALVDADISGDEPLDPEQLRLFEALAESAPAEIADDVDTFVAAFTEAGAASDPDAELEGIVDDPEVSGSISRVLEFFETSCASEDPVDVDVDVDADVDTGEIDPDALTDYLAAEPSTSDLADDVRVVVFGGSGVKLFTSLDAADASTLCESVLEYGRSIDVDVSVSLQSTALSADGETEVIVEGDSGGCVPV